MSTYELIADKSNIHWGFYDASLRPALTIDDGDTVVLTYATAYETAPLVFFFSCGEVGADGKFDIEVDTVASATTAFTLTASGTCVGVTQYLVIEAV